MAPSAPRRCSSEFRRADVAALSSSAAGMRRPRRSRAAADPGRGHRRARSCHRWRRPSPTWTATQDGDHRLHRRVIQGRRQGHVGERIFLWRIYLSDDYHQRQVRRGGEPHQQKVAAAEKQRYLTRSTRLLTPAGELRSCPASTHYADRPDDQPWYYASQAATAAKGMATPPPAAWGTDYEILKTSIRSGTNEFSSKFAI